MKSSSRPRLGPRTASDKCVSDLAIDGLRAGELEVEVARGARAHIAECQRCAARMAAIDADASAYLSAFPHPVLARRAPKRLRVSGAVAKVGGVLAMAAGIALIAKPSAERRGSAVDEVRLKGGDHVSYFVKRGDRVFPGGPADPLAPGDRLRFTYSARQTGHPRYLGILSLDAAGKASIYCPALATAAPIEPGIDVPLPSSVELDDTLGTETIVAVFCDEPVALEPIVRRLEETPGAALTAACTESKLTFQKIREP